MFVWELVSCRLRGQGWHVWHLRTDASAEPVYRVHLERPGRECVVSGPTLTEAYAAAARRAREEHSLEHVSSAPGAAPCRADDQLTGSLLRL
jgi:hypothetical protein